MRLSKAAILALKGLDSRGRKRVAGELKISPITLYRWISSNDDSLTKAAHLEVISKEIGLAVSDLLEKEPSEVKEA